MNLDARTLRPYAPLLVLIATIGLGWLVFVRPVSVDRAPRRHTARRVCVSARWCCAARSSAPAFAPRRASMPAIRCGDAFERQVAAGDASPALLEQLARLASAARARNLLIETVEAGGDGRSRSAGTASQRDPRFALFDVPVSHVPIRLAFDTDYASVGRFLWAFRDLPTTVEIRALSMGLPPADAGDEDTAHEPMPCACR